MGETIRLTASDGHELAAYRADPSGAPRGAIVVIQEIFGVNEHIRAVADGFAADGYTAVAPALFDRVERGVELGYDEEGRNRGRSIRANIAWDDAVRDIAAAVAAAPGPKVGVVGYCWGGSLAWLAATRLDGLAAAVCYYGGQIADFKDESPRCPVLLHFGSADQSIPMSDVEAIRTAHPDLPIHVYEGAGHGFNCDMRGSYDRDAATLARQRTMAMLAETVG
ncbi:MAG TPA: dienelactone hydrolase family protein [Alphaproteobacteria bacterium]|nr:dienelactone hydrolase family protein [Alphaproteobacteria bacterium]